MSVFIYLKLTVKEQYWGEFERDIEEMEALAHKQPGFIWSEALKSTKNQGEWVVLSEWESRDHSRAWEHSPRHDEIIKKWEEKYASRYVKRRFSSM